jgi:hypothetical protein
VRSSLELTLAGTPVPHPLALAHGFDVQHGHPPLLEADVERTAAQAEPPHADRRVFDARSETSSTHKGEYWLCPNTTGPTQI